MKNHQKLVSGMFYYKLFINTVRLILGFTLVYTNYNLLETSRILFRDIIIFSPRPFWLLYIIAMSWIFFSFIEIFFTILLKTHKKLTGAQGLFIMSILWIPIEILLILSFLSLDSVFALIADLFIIYLLFHIIKSIKKRVKDSQK